MDFAKRIDVAISQAIRAGQAAPSPGKLASALHYTVTPGGARIRQTILLSVAAACGDDQPEMANAAAAALELITDWVSKHAGVKSLGEKPESR